MAKDGPSIGKMAASALCLAIFVSATVRVVDNPAIKEVVFHSVKLALIGVGLLSTLATCFVAVVLGWHWNSERN